MSHRGSRPITSAIHPDDDCPENHLSAESIGRPASILPREMSREQLKRLEAALAGIDPAHAPAPRPRLVDGPPAPEEPTVVVPLRVAVRAESALYQLEAQLKRAADACQGDTEDRAGAWTHWSHVASALEALRPLVEAARQENRRRWAEHKAEWHRLRREAREVA